MKVRRNRITISDSLVLTRGTYIKELEDVPTKLLRGSMVVVDGKMYAGDSDHNPYKLGPTDLALGTRTADGVKINSSTGNNATIPAATAEKAGLFTAPDKEKLDGLEAVAGMVGYSTKADMDADTTQEEGTIGLVLNDTVENNGFYRWDGTAWVTGDGILLEKHDANVTVTVGNTGSGKDFEGDGAINNAIQSLANFLYPLYVNEGVTATIILDDNYVMKEQVLVKDIDLSWINITNESGTASQDIESITEGTELEASVAQIGDVTLDEYDSEEDKTIYNDLVVNLETGDGNKFYFYNSAGTDPGNDGTGVEVDTSGDTTEEEVAESYKDAIHGTTGFSATRTGRTITVTNDTAGEVTWSLDEESRATLEITTEGSDTVYAARFEITGHSYSVDDLVVIKNHEGDVEEINYDGLYEVDTIDTNWTELKRNGNTVTYDSARAGTGTTGEVTELKPISVERTSLDTQFEFFYYPAFGVARGKLPRISCLFEMDESALPTGIDLYLSYLDGLCATDNGEIQVDPFCGFLNATGSNIYGTRTSRINCNDGLADRAGRHGVWGYSETIINARRVFASDCGWAHDGNDRGDGWDSRGEPVGCGILADRGASINAEDADVFRSQGDNFCAHLGEIYAGSVSEKGVRTGDSINGIDFNSPGGTIHGIGTFGRQKLLDDFLIGGGYDKEHVGPKSLIAGNMNCGFFGEVTPEELFGIGNDSSWLISELGITQGSTLNQTLNWLKLALEGKVIFYPMTSIRHSISWDHIYIKGCVYGTGQTISDAEREMLDNAIVEDGTTIYKDWLLATEGVDRIPQTAQTTLNGKTYRVRLMKGVNDDPAPGTYGQPGVGMENEWNRLILPLYFQTKDYNWQRVIDGTSDYSDYVNSKTPDWGVYYTDDDLLTHYELSNGSRPWMQEFTKSHDPQRRVVRGDIGVTYLYADVSWNTGSSRGFRPVLESL